MRPAAIILAGGLGTRMRPLTERTPKPLLPVGGTPIVAVQLEQLQRSGVRDVVLATSYRAEDFDDVVAGIDLGLDVRISVEEQPLGTGGGLGVAATALPPGPPDQPVVVLNGDLLTGHDIAAQVRTIESAGPDIAVVLHVRDVEDARPFGSVVTDDEGVVTRFEEKSPHPPSQTVNAGTYVLRRSFLDELTARSGTGAFSLERDVFPDVVDGRRMLAHRDDAYFCDVGNPAALVRASADVVTRGVPFEDRPTGLARKVSPAAGVDPTARVDGGSSILPGAQVLAGATLDAAVVMAGATVGAGAVIRRSTVGPGATVADGAVLEDDVLV